MAKVIRTRIATNNVDKLRAVVDRLNKEGRFVKIESQIVAQGKLPQANIPINLDAKRYGTDDSEFTIAAESEAMSALLLQAGIVASDRCKTTD